MATPKAVAVDYAPHMAGFLGNMNDVIQLVTVHKEKAGSTRGRKFDVQVFNKSAIVLLVACWEAFIEDLATSAFDLLLDHADGPHVFPDHVLAIASDKIKGTKEVWMLAGVGWRMQLRRHRDLVLAQSIDRFNTPNAANINDVFSRLIGLTGVTRHWKFPGLARTRAEAQLEALIKVRGDIAHRGRASNKAVWKSDVRTYTRLITRLAVCTHNAVNDFIYERTGHYEWVEYDVDLRAMRI